MLEWDHIIPLHRSMGEQEFQPLCLPCHKNETTYEAQGFEWDILASSFEKSVYNEYVK